MRYYFVNEELDLSGSHGNVQKLTRSLVRTSCRLCFSYAPRCEWTSAGLSYANLLGNAPGFSRSFPAVSPKDSRNDGLWTKAPFSRCSEPLLRVAKGANFFVQLSESTVFSDFCLLENRKSLLLRLWNCYHCNQTPRNTPCHLTNSL